MNYTITDVERRNLRHVLHGALTSLSSAVNGEAEAYMAIETALKLLQVAYSYFEARNEFNDYFDQQ